MNVLNSNLVNWALRWAFSRSGVIVRWAVGYVIAWLAAKNIIPSNDLTQISVSLTSGLSAIVAVAYALAQFWLNKRAADGVNVVKTMVTNAAGGEQLQLNGVIGNQTIEAVAKVTNSDAHRAVRMALR
jgi:hypothetical protein